MGEGGGRVGEGMGEGGGRERGRRGRKGCGEGKGSKDVKVKGCKGVGRKKRKHERREMRGE